MKKISISILVITLVLWNCSSEQVKPVDNREELVKELNKKLEAIEIQGFGGDETTLPEKLYNDWAKKGIPTLKEVVPQVPDGYSFKVTGHADPYGGEEKALRIAEGRAKHIRSKVAKAIGLDESKVGIKNYGSEKFTQKKDKSISQNRRVEFQIYKN